MILRPQRNFTVVRQIADHTDSTTYYVRAVIRDAYTDQILDTLDLTSRGDQRYSKNWQVPADPSGLGREISIVTSVYTDSGYTTKSPNYGDEENSHIIEEKDSVGRGGGVDSYTVRRIIKEELAVISKKKKDEQKVEEEEAEEPARWDEVISEIRSLKKELKPEKPEKVNLTPIIKGLQDIAKMIVDKPITPETDLGPVLERINSVLASFDSLKSDVVNIVRGMEDILRPALAKEVKDSINSLQFTGQFSTIAVPRESGGVESERKEEEIDISGLTQ